MTPPVTHHKIACTYKLAPDFEQLPFLDKLKKIGFIDDQYNLLFTPSKTPLISAKGHYRFKCLMEKEVLGCDANGEIVFRMKESEYVKGFADFLSPTGIKTKTFLRGGYAAYVADLNEYLEFLIREFLRSKNLSPTLLDKEIGALKNQDEEEPHDVDLFDYVINEGIPPTALRAYFTQFINQKDIKFLQLLIPQVSTLFPYLENYVLFTLGNESFQTDRIIGRLNHNYLYTRDDIRIEITGNQIHIPESAGNFWQMVVDRKLKIARTESWHQKDFRAGLAALQLNLDGHILIEDDCSLESIFQYALSTGSDKIFQAAIDRARLHSQNKSAFLMSVLIAYLHAAKKLKLTLPTKLLQILTKEIGLKQLVTLLSDNKDFAQDLALLIDDDLELNSLERVHFELALQKPLTPLTESMKNALVEYLIKENESTVIAHLFNSWFSVSPTKTGWIQTLFDYSYKHGFKLWNAFKGEIDENDKWEILQRVALNRPNSCYALIDEEEIPNHLRIKLLKIIAKNPDLSHQTAVRIIHELMQTHALNDMETFLIRALEKEGYPLWKSIKSHVTPSLSLLKVIDRMIFSKKELPDEGLAWFYQSNPTKDRVKAIYPWVYLKIYLQFIKHFHFETLAKEWVESFPLSERMGKVLDFFSEYSSKDHPLLIFLCSLPGINERKILETLYSQGLPLFAGHSFSSLFSTLNLGFKEPILKTLAGMALTTKEMDALLSWMKKNPPTFDVLSHFFERKDHLPLIRNYLIYLQPTCKDPQFTELFAKVLDRDPLSSELIPFYKDQKWVRSQYDFEAKSKTEEWATAVLKENLKENVRSAVEDILARTKSSSYGQLKAFLQPFYNEKLETEEQVSSIFHFVVSMTLIAIGQEDVYRLHYIEIVFKLLKMGIASKLHTNNSLTLIEQIYDSVPLLVYKGGTFDPLIHHLQTLPLVDYGSEKLYNEWNEKREIAFQKWTKRMRPDEECEPLQILPYATLRESCAYAEQFIYITEQYIENKASKGQFQNEVAQLVKSAGPIFKPLKLLLHEDPCLICIQDLSHHLEDVNKRVRTYEAFYFLLNSWSNKMGKPSPHLIEKRNYLDVRFRTEDLIIIGLNQIKQKNVITIHILNSLNAYLATLLQSLELPSLHLQDPILDAFELNSIPSLEKIEFRHLWKTLLKASPNPFNLYQHEKISSYIAHGSKTLNQDMTEERLKNRINTLNLNFNSLDSDSILAEIAIILNSATLYLSEERVIPLRNYLETTLSIKIPVFYNENKQKLTTTL